MDLRKIVRGLFERKMVVLLVAIVLLFAVLFNSGMFGGTDSRIHISCVGDSLTYGSGVLKTREIDSYPAQLQARLGTSYLVSNFGLRNATASASADLPYIESEQYKESLKSNPDIVILMLGTNDTKTQNWNASEYRKGLTDLVETYKKLADGMGVSVHSLFEKLGNDATVNILPVQKIRKPFGKVIAGKVDEKVEKFFVEEHHYEPDIEIDPQYASMMKLWKVATPKARKAAMEVLRVMSDADE